MTIAKFRTPIGLIIRISHHQIARTPLKFTALEE